MDSIINSILAVMPQGLWETIIVAFESAFGTFALSIIVLTVILKIVTSPLDFLNRRAQKSMGEKQKKIQNQVDAINRKYANDSKTKNQKLGELYQREKINPMGSCVVIILNLVLTMVIFITLFNGMNAMAAYKITDQYEQLQIEYVQEYAQETHSVDILALIEENNNKASDDETKKSIYDICKPYIDELATEEKAEAKQAADARVSEKYKQIKEGFLWIDNIWIADSPFKNSIPTFDDYAGVAKISKDNANYENYKTAYNQIMTPLSQSNGRVNGFFILLVLTAGISFLNQWLTARRNKKDGQRTSIAAYIVMPVLMAIFTLFYTTMFSLYIIASQIVSIALIPVIGKINDAIDKRQAKKNEPTDRLKRI